MTDLQPPFINVSSIPNLRDIGGYNTSTGACVRKGLFYRAADPCRCDAAGVERLRDELGIRTIFDLRSKQEIDRNAGGEADVAAWEERLGKAQSPSENEASITRYWTPVFTEDDYSPEAVALRFRNYARGSDGFAKAYEQILIHGTVSFARILRYLASDERASSRRGILIHCTAGKDRTGVLTAVLLSLLGVDDEQIAAEYVLTEVGLREQKASYVQRLKAHEAFNGPDGPGEAGAIRMTTCTRENMLNTLSLIREKYGGAEGYVVDACGLSREEVESIRQRMVGIETDHPTDSMS